MCLLFRVQVFFPLSNPCHVPCQCSFINSLMRTLGYLKYFLSIQVEEKNLSMINDNMESTLTCARSRPFYSGCHDKQKTVRFPP